MTKQYDKEFKLLAVQMVLSGSHRRVGSVTFFRFTGDNTCYYTQAGNFTGFVKPACGVHLQRQSRLESLWITAGDVDGEEQATASINFVSQMAEITPISFMEAA